MALTLTTRETGVIGDLAYWMGSAQFDSSYLTGGESITASDLGLDRIYHLSITGDFLTTGLNNGGYFVWDKSADTIVMLESAGAGASLTEVNSGANRADAVVYIAAFGEHREDK